MVTDNFLSMACIQVTEINPHLDGFDTVKINDENDTCSIFHKDSTIIVCFAGSDDIGDWLGNSKFIKKQTVYGGVHVDFWESYAKIFKKIIKELHNLNFYDKEIYITGHSRGGALATLFAIDIPYKGNIKKLVTFGSPRVGDNKFKQSFIQMVKFPSKRYVNYLDIVPTVPFWGYEHIPESIYFDNKKKIVKKRPKNYLFLIRKIRGILNHSLDGYFENTKINNL